MRVVGFQEGEVARVEDVVVEADDPPEGVVEEFESVLEADEVSLSFFVGSNGLGSGEERRMEEMGDSRTYMLAGGIHPSSRW